MFGRRNSGGNSDDNVDTVTNRLRTIITISGDHDFQVTTVGAL